MFPAENFFNVFGGDLELIAISDCAFEEDPDAVGESIESGIVEGFDVIVGEVLAGSLELAGDLLEGVGLGLGIGESA